MTAWVFDVDGVLCPRNGKIEGAFKEKFLEWAVGKTIFLVTGSNREKTLSQIGEEVVNTARIVFNCMGNSFYVDGKHVLRNAFNLSQCEIDWILNYVDQSKSPVKTGNNFSFRPGSVNLSIVGSNATLNDRQAYIEWDCAVAERVDFIKKFTSTFAHYNAYIGGDVSVDICLAGANKGQCLPLIREMHPATSLHVFVDRYDEFGIDRPLIDNLTQNDKAFLITHFTETLAYL
jgi:phosphomannomutase